MHLLDFPGCCTAKIITGFGQSPIAAYGYRPPREYTEVTMYEELRDHLLRVGAMNQAVVFAITNSDQTTAEKVLPKAGFVCVQEKIGKNQHANKTISTWVYTVTDKDRRPLPIPANPWAKPKVEPVVQPVAQQPAPVQARPRPPFALEKHEARGVEYWAPAGVRALYEYRVYLNDMDHRRTRTNDILFTGRNPEGRFVARPKRRIPISPLEVARMYIPEGVLYTKVRPDGTLVGALRVSNDKTRFRQQMRDWEAEGSYVFFA